MKLEGIWKVKEMTCFGEDGAFWRSAEDCMRDDAMDDDVKEPLTWKYLFDADGTFKVLRPIPLQVPQEEIDRAAAAGQVELFDSRTMIVEQRPWKEENGKFYYDTGIQGEAMGEKTSPWVEIKETVDGIELMFYRLIRDE